MEMARDSGNLTSLGCQALVGLFTATVPIEIPSRGLSWPSD